jgi:hypothetical protein
MMSQHDESAAVSSHMQHRERVRGHGVAQLHAASQLTSQLAG